MTASFYLIFRADGARLTWGSSMDGASAGAAGAAISVAVPLPNGDSATLTVVPEGVNILVARLRDASAHLREIQTYTDHMRYVDPPGDDPFSGRSADDINAVGRQWFAVHQAACEEFRRVVQGLHDALATYAATEADNTGKFRGGS